MKTELPTICAISTPEGNGAIAVIRLSGADAFEITNHFYQGKDKTIYLEDLKSRTVYFGQFISDSQIVDEVLITLYRAPHSYTGENMVEISCHGSRFIRNTIMISLLEGGAELAKPGEFTMRAYLNGKMDLSQAEGVADLIAANTIESHRIAMNQMRGGFSHALQLLRHDLLQLISLVELELDFAEEDVEFASREDLINTTGAIYKEINKIKSSFKYGQAMKEGIPVVIAGNPNVGKSTLLNLILNEDKAIVSEIAGTTRDSIEDVCQLEGMLFRFIDTAGLRETADRIEKIGIERTLAKIRHSKVLIYLLDGSEASTTVAGRIKEIEAEWADKNILFVVNKADLLEDKNQYRQDLRDKTGRTDILLLSARDKWNIDHLLETLISTSVNDIQTDSGVIISSMRHYEALHHAGAAIERVMDGMQAGLSLDLIANDIRQVIHYLGEITGEISTDDILGNIFGQFCIGK